MKTYFTAGERTYGLFKASLLICGFFAVLGGIIGIISLFAVQLYGIALVVLFLGIAVPVTLLSCQLFGQPIWFLGDVFRLNTIFYCTLQGALTGIAMQIIYGYYLSDGVLAFHPIGGSFMAIVGAICGANAYLEADKLREARIR